VHIKVEADAAGVTEGSDLRREGAVLGRITRCNTLVCLGARVGGCSASHFPLVRPVTIDISADTAVATDGLTVLAPQAIGGLGVYETIWVHDRSDVEIELVDDGLDACIGGRLGEKLPGEVFSGHTGDPLPGVHISVDDNGRP